MSALKNEKITFTGITGINGINEIECDGTTHTENVDMTLQNRYEFRASLSQWFDESGGAVSVNWSAEFTKGTASSPTSGTLHVLKEARDKCAVDVNTDIDLVTLVLGNTNSASFTRNLVKDSANLGAVYVILGSVAQNGGVIKNEKGNEILYNIIGGTWSPAIGMYYLTSDESSISVSVPSDIPAGKYTDTATVIISCE